METMSPSPYEPPPSQLSGRGGAPPPLDAGPPPSSIKVFGILHLIVAGFGIFSGIWTVLVILYFKDFMGWMNGLGGRRGADAQQAAQMAYMAEIQWLTWLQLGASVVLIGLLLIAGVHLLKRRDRGRVWSVRYGWTSIATKAVTLVLMIIYGLPAASRMNEAMLDETAPAMAGMAGIMTMVSTVVGIVSTMIYPILVISILNGRRVRDYLADR
jgi:hypothetical protein